MIALAAVAFHHLRRSQRERDLSSDLTKVKEIGQYFRVICERMFDILTGVLD
jgi:hypothetical protein